MLLMSAESRFHYVSIVPDKSFMIVQYDRRNTMSIYSQSKYSLSLIKNLSRWRWNTEIRSMTPIQNQSLVFSIIHFEEKFILLEKVISFIESQEETDA